MSEWTAEPIGKMWIVINPIHPYGRALASRIRVDGTRSRVWPTREAAERAAARLNRKYTHECPGLYRCMKCPVPVVTHSGASWEVYVSRANCGDRYPTQTEAFAAALEYARNAVDLTPEPTC